MSVGGMTDDHEHMDWISGKKLRVGDEITIRIMDSNTSDGPVRRERMDTKKMAKISKEIKEWQKKKYAE
ncbi:MAG: hypothetical protein K8I00_04965 [Candidatus Omnitrophica bacterium]|nr:hypothetical protein [Candidatus Omnitrophota bacterium]